MSQRGGQGRRQREKAIRALLRQIAQHEAKIADNPSSPARSHWEVELATFRVQLEKQRRRLGRG